MNRCGRFRTFKQAQICQNTSIGYRDIQENVKAIILEFIRERSGESHDVRTEVTVDE